MPANFSFIRLSLLSALCVAGLLVTDRADARPPTAQQVLFDSTTGTDALEIVSNVDRQSHTVEDGGLLVTIEPGEKATPTLFVKPASGSWDLSDYGHIVATITNLDQEAPLRIHLRVDNDGKWQDKPWNTEVIRVLPGKTQPLKVIFGHHYGYKPGFKLDPSKVSKVALFIEHPEDKYTYRVESIVAGGEKGEKPEVNPASTSLKPADGVILGKQAETTKGLRLSANDGEAKPGEGVVHLAFEGGAANPVAAVRPSQGRWNLNEHLQVSVTLTNEGATAVTPTVWLESSKGPSDKIAAESPIAPGATSTLVIPFAGQTLWQGPQNFEAKPYHGTGGTRLASDAVSGVFVSPSDTEQAAQLRIDSITAGMPERVPMPDWVGKRPPVEGDWQQTMNENFDGPIDSKIWNIYASNFWDKKSHFSKDNVIVEDGLAKLRFERKTGRHNDDPERKVTDYATGHLDTYGKWTQRYGYFEARMKLPTAPGLWPAFWLISERGEEAGPQWTRADTGNGGMEFDIMEHLTRWGPNRFTHAFHWDGYRENHKATGTPAYFQPDEEGFVTSGLLWLPGVAVLYTNGVETARWEIDRIASVPSNIIFTAVSGGWDNDPIDDAMLPDDFVIDYVRVWQRSDLATDDDGLQP